MNLPNFLIIGAAKSGTTALYHFLSQHPDVFLAPNKEPQFFAFEGEKPAYRGPGTTINETAVTRIEDYRALFEGVRGQRAVGEASALYLYVPEAAERIRRRLPEARLIAVLRNPVERAFSSFMHLRREGREPLATFADALRAETQRIEEHWGFLWRYRDMGLYSEQLRRFYERFPREQLRVILYEDFRDAPRESLRDIFQFLEIDPDFQPDLSGRHNVSGIPRSRLAYEALWGSGRTGQTVRRVLPVRALERLRSRLEPVVLEKQRLAPALRADLTAVFREDVLELQELIGRDLSRWLGTPAPEDRS